MLTEKTEWGSCLVIMCFEAFVYNLAKTAKRLKCSLVEFDKRPIKPTVLACNGFYYTELDSPFKTQNTDVIHYCRRHSLAFLTDVAFTELTRQKSLTEME